MQEQSTGIAAALAHKQSHGNLWLSRVHQQNEHELSFIYQLPEHLPARAAEYIEVQRQATHAYAHSYLAVPLDAASMLTSISIDINHEAAVKENLPRKGIIAVKSRKELSTNSTNPNINVVTQFQAEEHVATGSITGQYLPQKIYERIRATYRQEQCADEDSQSCSHKVAHLSEDLSVLTSNPMLEDHEVDHISGMAVIWGLQQLLQRETQERALRRLHCEFLGFIEKHWPARLNIDMHAEQLSGFVGQREKRCVEISGAVVTLKEALA